MIQFCLFAFLLLVPCVIEDLREPKDVPVAASPTEKPAAARSIKRSSPPVWRPRGEARLNRTAFLREFEDQATEDLLPCLRVAIGEKGSATFMARMQRDGRMTALRMINPPLATPACARDAADKMVFNPQRLDAHDRDVEIEWRFDW